MPCSQRDHGQVSLYLSLSFYSGGNSTILHHWSKGEKKHVKDGEEPIHDGHGAHAETDRGGGIVGQVGAEEEKEEYLH